MDTAVINPECAMQVGEKIYSQQVTIVNKKGLHARAAAMFAKEAEKFISEIKVEKGGVEVLGTSIMGLMMLAADKGSKINIATCGANDAEKALGELVILVENGFYED